MGPLANAAMTIAEDFFGSDPDGKEIDRACARYVRRMGGGTVEMVLELADAVRALVEERADRCAVCGDKRDSAGFCCATDAGGVR